MPPEVYRQRPEGVLGQDFCSLKAGSQRVVDILCRCVNPGLPVTEDRMESYILDISPVCWYIIVAQARRLRQEHCKFQASLD